MKTCVNFSFTDKIFKKSPIPPITELNVPKMGAECSYEKLTPEAWG